jgi:hypothetical protein
MTMDDLRNDFECYDEDLRDIQDIQDILDDPTLDEAEKLDAIADVAALNDGDDDGEA